MAQNATGDLQTPVSDQNQTVNTDKNILNPATDLHSHTQNILHSQGSGGEEVHTADSGSGAGFKGGSGADSTQKGATRSSGTRSEEDTGHQKGGPAERAPGMRRNRGDEENIEGTYRYTDQDIHLESSERDRNRREDERRFRKMKMSEIESGYMSGAGRGFQGMGIGMGPGYMMAPTPIIFPMQGAGVFGNNSMNFSQLQDQNVQFRARDPRNRGRTGKRTVKIQPGSQQQVKTSTISTVSTSISTAASPPVTLAESRAVPSPASAVTWSS